MIPDFQITASSVNNNNYQPPAQARLNSLGWTAALYDRKSWLQIDLGSYKIVTRLATRGSSLFWIAWYRGTGSWVTSYRLQFSDDGFMFHFYQEPRDSSAKVCKNDLIIILFRIRLFRFFSLFFLMCRCLAEIETLSLLCIMNSASQSQHASSGYCLYSGIITYQ